MHRGESGDRRLLAVLGSLLASLLALTILAGSASALPPAPPTPPTQPQTLKLKVPAAGEVSVTSLQTAFKPRVTVKKPPSGLLVLTKTAKLRARVFQTLIVIVNRLNSGVSAKKLTVTISRPTTKPPKTITDALASPPATEKLACADKTQAARLGIPVASGLDGSTARTFGTSVMEQLCGEATELDQLVLVLGGVEVPGFIPPADSGPSDPVNPTPSDPTPTDPGPTTPPDTTPPETALDSGIAEGALTNANTQEFSFGSTETGSSFECKLDDGDFAPCSSPKTYSALSDGQHTFSVRARDAAGNVDRSPVTRSFEVDATPPQTTIDSGPPPFVAPTGTRQISFSSSEANSTFECKLGAAAFTACTSPQTIAVSSVGAYDFEVRAIDRAGSADLSPATRSFKAKNPENRCGTLTQDETWSTQTLSGVVMTCDVTVPAGRTLTIEEGVFVKAGSGIDFIVQGTLEANGTAANPVTLTSINDDTIAGDTNGNGAASAPAPGNWDGIRAQPAGSGQPNPTLDLDHVAIRYAQGSISTSQTITSITNSSIDEDSSTGIGVSSPVGNPTVSGNTVTDAGGDAIAISSAVLDLAKLDGNSGSSNGLNGVRLQSTELATNSSLPWSGSFIPVLGSCSGLLIRPNVKLTMNAGTVIKGAGGCGDFIVQGTLEANGTAANPVTLTSINDDTIAGDTNGNGAASAPAPGNWDGIRAQPAGSGQPNPTLDLDHVAIRYAQGSISTSQTITSITNSSIDEDSSTGIGVSSPVGNPTVSGNTVTDAGGDAIAISSAVLDLAKLDGNSGSSNGLNGVRLQSTELATNSSLPWSGSFIPVLGSCSGLLIRPNVKLTMNAGTVIKGAGGCGDFIVQGTLEANGTAANPVTLTSINDDTIAGDTNGNGAASAPAPGNWDGIRAQPAGSGQPNPTLDLDHVAIRYAQGSISTSQTITSITNSSIDEDSSTGIGVSSPVGNPTVSGNTVTDAGGDAIAISSAVLDLAKLDGNSGSSNGLNGVRLQSTELATNSSLPWSGSFIPVLGSCSGLLIRPNVKLTMNAGTVIKGAGGCGDFIVQGTLEANGTAANPVTLTSINDDTIAGDTNGNGAASAPAPGNWDGIRAQPAGSGQPNPTLDLDHVAIRYAQGSISTSQTITSITNSSIDEDSSTGIGVSSPVGNPTVSGNTVTDAGGDAIAISSAVLDLAKLDGNSGSSNGLNGVRLQSTELATNSSLPWSGSLSPCWAPARDY